VRARLQSGPERFIIVSQLVSVALKYASYRSQLAGKARKEATVEV